MTFAIAIAAASAGTKATGAVTRGDPAESLTLGTRTATARSGTASLTAKAFGRCGRMILGGKA